MKLILKYFPELSEKQTEQFRQLDVLYHDWNAKINVISRKDIDNLYEHHVLHSLGIAEFTRFKSGTEIMDLGTGGGFPGIPLAIMFPDCHFHLVDSIGKKRPYLPEGGRIGERDEPVEEPHNGYPVERVLYGRIFCHQESGVRFTLKV